jgi:hypothetical protein
MFVAFHSGLRGKPVLIAAALSLLLLGVGIWLRLS